MDLAKSQARWIAAVLLSLLVVFLGNLFISGFESLPAILLLMGLSYLSNATYSMVSRSGVRNSISYHAVTTLVSNLVFYLVLKVLVTENMTLLLFIPYTVATVYGSVTGSKVSQWVEERFGITTDTSRKKPTPESIKAQKRLAIILGISAVFIAVFSKDILVTLLIAGLAFGDNITFSILRRSRNTSSVAYHIAASIVKSLAWFFLFQSLSLRNMPFDLFIPYCFGSVLGGITGQGISSWVEEKIGANADGHVFSGLAWYKFIPIKTAVFLSVLLAVSILLSGRGGNFLYILSLLSAGQQLAFSFVSRSRQRNNNLYHAIASIFSNGVWFLTFRQLQVQHWTFDLFIPYAIGGTIGSIMGVGISMGIEKWLKITSDNKKTS